MKTDKYYIIDGKEFKKVNKTQFKKWMLNPYNSSKYFIMCPCYMEPTIKMIYKHECRVTHRHSVEFLIKTYIECRCDSNKRVGPYPSYYVEV